MARRSGRGTARIRPRGRAGGVPACQQALWLGVHDYVLGWHYVLGLSPPRRRLEAIWWARVGAPQACRPGRRRSPGFRQYRRYRRYQQTAWARWPSARPGCRSRGWQGRGRCTGRRGAAKAGHGGAIGAEWGQRDRPGKAEVRHNPGLVDAGAVTWGCRVRQACRGPVQAAHSRQGGQAVRRRNRRERRGRDAPASAAVPGCLGALLLQVVLHVLQAGSRAGKRRAC